jgi:diadenosine tetraphosphate (Ap4A) HIT family hydrolase
MEIISADGIKKEIDCIGCALQRGEIEHVGEKVGETENFEVGQDYEIPIPGFMILASKKHLKGIGDFNDSERSEYIDFLFRIRKAIEKVLEIEYVYIIQEEDTIAESSHFHVWLFPRLKWMEKFGRGIKSVKPIMEYARKEMKTQDNLKEVKRVTTKIKEYLLEN